MRSGNSHEGGGIAAVEAADVAGSLVLTSAAGVGEGRALLSVGPIGDWSGTDAGVGVGEGEGLGVAVLSLRRGEALSPAGRLPSCSRAPGKTSSGPIRDRERFFSAGMPCCPCCPCWRLACARAVGAPRSKGARKTVSVNNVDLDL